MLQPMCAMSAGHPTHHLTAHTTHKRETDTRTKLCDTESLVWLQDSTGQPMMMGNARTYKRYRFLYCLPACTPLGGAATACSTPQTPLPLKTHTQRTAIDSSSISQHGTHAFTCSMSNQPQMLPHTHPADGMHPCVRTPASDHHTTYAGAASTQHSTTWHSMLTVQCATAASQPPTSPPLPPVSTACLSWCLLTTS